MQHHNGSPGRTEQQQSMHFGTMNRQSIKVHPLAQSRSDLRQPSLSDQFSFSSNAPDMSEKALSSLSSVSTEAPHDGEKRCRMILIAGIVAIWIGILAALGCFFYIRSINECDKMPCEFGARCYDHWFDYSCRCDRGYQGYDCDQLIDYCASNPCQNGGTCNATVGSYDCQCQPGFTSSQCEVEINECLSNPCQNFASCIDLLDAYTCHCADGFHGVHCENETDECLSNPCQFGGTCVNRINDFVCVCPDGYTDKNCSTEIDECASNPCEGGSTCHNNIDGFECSCAPGHYGSLCQYMYSEMYACCSDPCMNRGLCEQERDSNACDCMPGYYGPTCNSWDPLANDIVFVVDTTSSVDPYAPDFQKFCKDIVKALSLGSTESKIAFTSYADIEWDLHSSTSTDRDLLLDGCDYDYPLNGNIVIDGFLLAYPMLIDQGRDNAPNYIILMGDGGGGLIDHKWVNEVVEREARVLIVVAEPDQWGTIELYNSYEEDRFLVTQVNDVIAVLQS